MFTTVSGATPLPNQHLETGPSSMKETTGTDVLAHTVYSKSIFCLVMLFIANEEKKKNNVVACMKNANLAEFACTQIHFSLFNQPSRHESS